MIHRLIQLAALAMVLMLGAAGAARAEDPLKVVPAQAEVVVGINVKTIAASDLFKDLREAHPEINAQIEVIRNLTGINVTQDAERVVVFGKLDKKDFGGVVFVGKYDKEKMLALLKTNPKFKESTVDNLSVYEFLDGKKKEMRYAAILPDNTAVICNSKATAEACLAAIKDPAQSFAGTPEAALAPNGAGESAAWVLVVNRSDKGPAAKYKISALYGMVNLGGGNATLTLGLAPLEAADIAKWVDLAKGLAAVGQLQPDNAEVREIAAGAKAAPAADGKSATLTIAVEQGKLIKLLAKKKSAAK